MKTLQEIVHTELTNSFCLSKSELLIAIEFGYENFYYDKGKYLIPFRTVVISEWGSDFTVVNYCFVIKDNQIIERIYNQSYPFHEEHTTYHKNLVENTEDKIMECIGNYSELQLLFLPDCNTSTIKDEINKLREEGWIDLSEDLQI